jgi:hypothetical protein
MTEILGFKFQVSGGKKVTTKNFMDVEDLKVYKKLCQLHIEVCDLTHIWPQEERYELGSQARRSSNSAPSQLAETERIHHRKGVSRVQGPLQRMHSHAERIGENIGAENSGARAALAGNRGVGCVWLE